MQNTTNLKLKKPENTDPVEIQDFNDNADILDQAVSEKVDKTGDGSNITNKFSQAASRTNLVSGEKQSISLGKIMKYLTDLKVAAFSGAASDITPDAAHRFTTDAEKAAWNAKVTAAGGDIADTKVSGFTASTVAYPVPVAGDTPRVFMGKIKKFFEDMNNLRASMLFIGGIVNNCVTNNAGLPLSAAQGKVLMDLYTQLNSGKASTFHLHDDRYYTESEMNSMLSWKYISVSLRVTELNQVITYQNEVLKNAKEVALIHNNIGICHIPVLFDTDIYHNFTKYTGEYYWVTANISTKISTGVIRYTVIAKGSSEDMANNYITGILYR